VTAPAFLPWQASQSSRFQAARNAGRVGHAWLLSGPQGVGKRQFADWMAAALLCESPDSAGNACGRCRSCVLFVAGSHPDRFVLSPEPDKRDIAIDAVRELCERLALSAQLRRAKVACIDTADELNANGVNALLKTIEEPPADAYLLLLSSRPLSLPATLRSRCQRVNFAVPDGALADEWLVAHYPDAAAPARAAALKLAFGAPLAAGRLLEAGTLERDGQWRSTLADVSSGKVDPLSAANRIVPTINSSKDRDRSKEDLRSFMGWIQAELHHRLLVHVSDPAASPLPEGLDKFRQGCVDALRQLERNANLLLTLESVLIGWRGLTSRKVAR
jgi:DNA polymerase-3 subunit delta'